MSGRRRDDASRPVGPASRAVPAAQTPSPPLAPSQPCTEPGPDLDALAVAALRARPSTAENAAWHHPPYPTPSVYVPFHEAAVAALRERIASGPDLWCTTRLLDRPSPFLDDARRVVDRVGMFDPGDTLRLLLAGGLLSLDAAEEAVQIGREGAFTQRAIVYRLLGDGEIDSAREAAASAAMGEYTWVAWRAVGEHYASEGDVAAFFALWSTYDARQERAWITRMRSDLVAAVGAREGWRAAVDLLSDRRLGRKYLGAAVSAHLSGRSAPEIATFLDHEPGVSDLPETTRIGFMLAAMKRTTPRSPEADHPDLHLVLEKILAIDPTVSTQASRTRDTLLLRCWPAIGDEGTLKRVRAAARAPRVRSELRCLPRDIEAADER